MKMMQWWIPTVLAAVAAQDLFVQEPISVKGPPGPPVYPVPPQKPPEVKSFTIHVVHRPADPKSVAAKNTLRAAFCNEFLVHPCSVTTSRNESLLQLVDDLVVSVPFASFHDVASFFMQHRIARMNPPALVDLDLMVHPNTAAGPSKDINFGLWAGQPHPVDMNAVYKQGSSALEAKAAVEETAVATDVDKWAYSCSYDASGQGKWCDLCSKGPFAPNTTCRSKPKGAHIHLFYNDGNADESRAKEVFTGITTKALNLSLEICHDNYGHEQPHDKTCWLGGPTNMPPPGDVQVGGPPPPPAGSFVASQFSIYVTNEDFAKVVSWVMLSDVSEVIGHSLDFLLHPIFGCNFADHQQWSLHKGPTPNNLYGIQNEGGWTDSKSPSRLDPLGPDAAPTCGCKSPSASSYALHLLYNPVDQSEVMAKDNLITKLKANFQDSSVQFVKDVPHSFLDEESPFLAGQAYFKVGAEAFGKVTQWLAAERGSTDVLLVPSTCCGAKYDYTSSAMWAGRQWPLNTVALKDTPAQVQTEFLERRASELQADDQVDLLLYVNYASANAYQVAAIDKFLSSFSKAFSVNRSACTSKYPAIEPDYKKLCMMSEISEAGQSDPLTTSYAAVYVPASDRSRVLSWAMTHRSADVVGYQVDLLIVPMTGDVLGDYYERAFRVGTAWGLNDAALVAAASSGATAALNLPASVHYYRSDNVDQYSRFNNGATLRRWDVDRDFQADWALSPPFLVRHEIPVGATFPSWGGSFWFQGDSYSTVISGNATFGKDGKIYQYGDLFWVMGGHSHGPITNVGKTPLVVDTISTSPLLARRSYTAPSDLNPGVDTSHTTSRGYRQVDGGDWAENPSPHTKQCLANGGVQNMGFFNVNNTPAVLRVKWAPNCSIPYHYHPTGAMYFIQYGKMFFKGDLNKGGDDVSFESGEVRWVRPGFDYGPEYNSVDEHMQITVIGTETPPMFQSPPPGPYKFQKTSTVTAVFDEL